MTLPSEFAPSENPFSARRIRPGAVAYRFPPGESVETLLERLRGHDWRGRIAGPHGSGKSTLLMSLLPAIEGLGKPTLLVTLHDAQRRLPPDLQFPPAPAPGTLVIVDGYEQLSLVSRYRLHRLCRRRQLGLLVTTHGTARLPEVFRTTTNPDLAQSLVAELLGKHRDRIAPEEIAERFAVHRGNLREVLFDLYDLYERRTRTAQP